MSERVRVLVITGFGLNCEVETSAAFELAGAEVSRVHLNDIVDGLDRISNYHILAFVGGFSFGDHIAGGRVLAIRMKYRLPESVAGFIERGGLVIGICNGFQTITKMGILPGLDGDYATQRVTLTWNDVGVFQDRWVHLKADPQSRCVFTEGLDRMDMCIRHGEGKFVAENDAVLARLQAEGLVALRYVDEAGNPAAAFPGNPNGSVDGIAGICDPTGRVFGLMPHPEAFVLTEHHPDWTRRKAAGEPLPEPLGRRIFENAVRYVRQA